MDNAKIVKIFKQLGHSKRWDFVLLLYYAKKPLHDLQIEEGLQVKAIQVDNLKAACDTLIVSTDKGVRLEGSLIQLLDLLADRTWIPKTRE